MRMGGRLVLTHELVDGRNGMGKLGRLKLDVGLPDSSHRGIYRHLETTLVEGIELPGRAHVELKA